MKMTWQTKMKKIDNIVDIYCKTWGKNNERSRAMMLTSLLADIIDDKELNNLLDEKVIEDVLKKVNSNGYYI